MILIRTHTGAGSRSSNFRESFSRYHNKRGALCLSVCSAPHYIRKTFLSECNSPKRIRSAYDGKFSHRSWSKLELK